MPFRRKGGRNKRENEPGTKQNSPENNSRSELILENARFESYYRAQRICPDDEWEQFWRVCRSELPLCFRVSRSNFAAQAALVHLRDRFERDDKQDENDSTKMFMSELPWFPHHLAWELKDTCAWAVKRDPKHQKLKATLRCLQEIGALTRQEAVSMIPPLCLDVQPDHLVLDLCAAPGSKTSQILDKLLWEGTKLPRGAVIANEINSKRADVLAHQVGRLGSGSVVVTNFDAQFFPSPVSENGEPLLFDRVLADVPCSGDGTMRKYPTLWSKWTPRDALALHKRQLTILCRGLDLLRPGGRLVYSTCSLNPIENEAVVSAALQKYGSSLTLLPFPQLSDLRGLSGLETWLVPHPNVDQETCWKTYEEVPQDLQGLISPSQFPASPGSPEASAWADSCQCCHRFLPHSADTGGFFVAIFQKLENFTVSVPAGGDRIEAPSIDKSDNTTRRCEVEVCTNGDDDQCHDGGEDGATCAVTELIPQPSNDTDKVTEQPKSVRRWWDRKKNRALRPISDYENVPADAGEWTAAVDYFGLPREGRFKICQKKGLDKRMYCVSEGAARFLLSQAKMSVRIIIAGVRILERMAERRDGTTPAWRVCSEGMPVLSELGIHRSIALGSTLMQQFLKEREVPLDLLLTDEVSGLSSLISPETVVEGNVVTASQLVSGSLAVTLQPYGSSREDANGRHCVAFGVAAILSHRGIELNTPTGEANSLLQSLEVVGQTSSQL